ncbi:hypothetical protein [Azotobacter beijerinckii]|uniref:hypothetical protein n=1 Tax=Azotobacter beijerinckii TaxID=170623 RepID=UPI000B8345A5|nr:hypothetical protein [Azotobacter beijerinckii]
MNTMNTLFEQLWGMAPTRYSGPSIDPVIYQKVTDRINPAGLLLLGRVAVLLTLAPVAVLLAGLLGAFAACTLTLLRFASSLLAWLTWLFFSGHDEVLT